MDMTDVFQMEETKDRQTTHGVRDLSCHVHIRRLIKVMRRRVEHDAASDYPQLTPDGTIGMDDMVDSTVRSVVNLRDALQ